MSFASLQSAYVPLHTALTFDSFSPTLAACDDLLANLQSLHSALSAPSSSSSSSPASLSNASKQLLLSLSSHKAQHSRSFKQLHSLTRELGRQLDSVIASSLLDTATLTPRVLDRQRVDDVVEDALWREGLQDVAKEFRRERAAVDREAAAAAGRGGGTSEQEEGASDDADDAVRGMGRMFDIKRRLEEREVNDCLAWVREEEEKLRQRLERLREAKAKEDEKAKKGRQDGDGDAAREERMADDDDEDRVGLALDMFAPSTPASGSAAQPSASSSASASSSPPVPLSVQLTGLQSLYDDLHALHFDLHRIRFLQLLTATAPATAGAGSDGATAAAQTSSSSSSTLNGQQALLYAQTHFGLFAKERIDDIRKLSGLLLFYPNLTASPYANILTPPTSPTASSSASWSAAISSSSSTSPSPSASAFSPTSPSALSSHLAAASATFSSLFLRLHSLPPTPPLTTVLAAASVAYPQLAHYQRLPLSSSVSLELDLRSSFPFHSTFICPVTREPSHAGNEPVMLVCGHLISAAAMDKIVRGLRVTRKFKCPTCPREQTPQEVIAVKL